jgi:hypothetical protein
MSTNGKLLENLNTETVISEKLWCTSKLVDMIYLPVPTTGLLRSTLKYADHVEGNLSTKIK